jgi:hypothetical protein
MPNISLWLKGDDVELNGDRVSWWYDMSGNGYDAYQTVQDVQPYYMLIVY